MPLSIAGKEKKQMGFLNFVTIYGNGVKKNAW